MKQGSNAALAVLHAKALRLAIGMLVDLSMLLLLMPLQFCIRCTRPAITWDLQLPEVDWGCNASTEQSWKKMSLQVCCCSLSHLPLLLTCRAHCVPGYIVPRHELAFSQPTEAGRHLAAKYTGTDHFLVYMSG